MKSKKTKEELICLSLYAFSKDLRLAYIKTCPALKEVPHTKTQKAKFDRLVQNLYIKYLKKIKSIYK